MFKMLLVLMMREWRLSWRRAGDIGLSLGFMLISASLFPLAVGPEPERLSMIGGGVIWVLALIAVLISLDRLFQQDHDDGVIAQLLLSPISPILIILAKAIIHWATTAIPLIAVIPLAGLFLNLPTESYLPLLAGLLLATPSLSLIGTMGAALTLGARRSALLMTLLVLPLYIPILIFAVMALEIANSGLSPRPYFLILGAFLALAIALCPLGGATALKYHQD